MKWNNTRLWLVWLAITMMMSGYFAYSMTSEDQTLFLPGETSHGHYQIELKCNACHGGAFDGRAALQKACVKCHGKELKIADDKHPKSKFTDPRNADRVAKLDARVCITCHVEHKPEITREMGVTVAADTCRLCHYDIAKDRKSHKGMAFTTCDSAGCHNFHDNRGLYEDFLAKHLDEDDVFSTATVKAKSRAKQLIQLFNYPKESYPLRPLGSNEQDAPESFTNEQKILQDWHQTTHAKSGVNCSACHRLKDKVTHKTTWLEKPDHSVCQQCHSHEVDGFLAGRHGMRLAQQLEPMTPAQARIPMRSQAHDRKLTCASCHSDHQFDVRRAAVDACLACHNDKHSRAYKGSPHYQLWLKETSAASLVNTGVSCATCHFPRQIHKQDGVELVVAQHNQNDNLRPNEKMLRSVCMDCHGLGFSIDALADRQLVAANFKSKPSRHIESLDMTRKRLAEKAKEKNANKDLEKSGGDDNNKEGFL